VVAGVTVVCFFAVTVPAIGGGSVHVTANASGSGNRLIATVFVGTSPHEVCWGRVTHSGRTARLPSLRTSSAGGGRWQWRIPRRVRGGRWRVSVTCRRSGAKQRAAAHFRTARVRGARRRTHLVAPGTMTARAWKGAERSTGVGGGDELSLYPRGECTYFAALKRPDIPFFDGVSGNAKNWARSAELAGFRVSAIPAAGAIGVAQPGQIGAGEYGHVFHVDWVANDRMGISEANWQGRKRSTRTIRWPGRKLQFIHEQLAPPPQVMPPPVEVALKGYRHHIYRTCAYGRACGVRRREGPGLAFAARDLLPDGSEVFVECQTVGDRVIGRDATSTNVWNRLVDGGWVPDYFVDTTGKADRFTTPIPRCGSTRGDGPPVAGAAPPPAAEAAPAPAPAPTRVDLGATPANGDIVTGRVQLSAASDAPAVQFAAFYADDPGKPGTASWHVLGTDESAVDGFFLDWDTATVPNQGQPIQNTVRVMATAVDSQGEATALQDVRRVAASNPNADGSFTYHVFGTCPGGTCYANVRTAPTTQSRKIGEKEEGDPLRISCQARGEMVTDGAGGSSDVWDQLDDGTWVSDYYVDTPRAGRFSPPIPVCP
jgi:surface antigen